MAKTIPHKAAFEPAETAVMKAAYDDAASKLGGFSTILGPNQGLAKEIIGLAALRATSGQSLSGHSDAQLLSFLARQSLK